jgi:hypothetical protein
MGTDCSLCVVPHWKNTLDGESRIFWELQEMPGESGRIRKSSFVSENKVKKQSSHVLWGIACS